MIPPHSTRPARGAAKAAVATLLFAVQTVLALEPTTQPVGEIKLGDCLVIESVGQSGRAVIHTDAIEARLVAGQWTAPKAGDVVTLPDGATKRWAATQPGKDGWLSHPALEGGYGYWPVEVPDERVMLLEAQGHSLVYVNGVPRAGDPSRWPTR